jgi:hypothetical protein
MLRIFITLKSPSSKAMFESTNLGPNGMHATTRPPRATSKMIIEEAAGLWPILTPSMVLWAKHAGHYNNIFIINFSAK